MKRLRLKSWVKVVLLLVAFISIFIHLLSIGSDRADRIDRGVMDLVEHNEADR